MAWTLWGRGLVAAVVSSVVSAGTAVVLDPTMWAPRKLVALVVTSGATGALLYLKQHPVPDAQS